MNKSNNTYKMLDIFEVSGISRQMHNNYNKRREQDAHKEQWVVEAVMEARRLNTMLGLKKIFYKLSPEWIGRDRFIEIGMEYGLGIKKLRSYHKTTYSNRSIWFDNLTRGLQIIGINQVWVSDITYFRIGDEFYYITFIEDVYSRRILGYTVYKTLEAEANCLALKMAIEVRSEFDLRGVIHHSDRGTQYLSNKYLGLLADYGIAVSLCTSVYENTHIERLNQTIKYEYLQESKVKSFEELKRFMPKAIKDYNESRLHIGIKWQIPCEYEKKLERIPMNERVVMELYAEPKKKYMQSQLF